MACAVLALICAAKPSRCATAVPDTTRPGSPPAAAPSETGIDLRQLEARLKSGGLAGWVHGAVKGQELYVFTYRDPKNFFASADFPLVSRSPQVLKQLRALNRHDQVLIQGSFLERPAPQKHIEVTGLRVLKRWSPADAMPAYVYRAKLPEELLGKKELVGKVHAV
ncbi:MAG: hypothetical protein KY468_21090, partial [Armatimonadetes bacterium]|nr:hypothetical protein [Armatimonadota bacterium]